MTKDNIIQFVGFTTQLDFNDFVGRWEHYASQFMRSNDNSILQQEESKSRYKFLSQHMYKPDDLRFNFMKGRNAEFFPDQKVRVVQAGGYSPIQIECENTNGNSKDHKIMAFLPHDEYDLDFYRDLKLQKHLNIYQAYFENCAYGYILEYFVPQKNSAELLQQLKTRPQSEPALYKACVIPKLAKA